MAVGVGREAKKRKRSVFERSIAPASVLAQPSPPHPQNWKVRQRKGECREVGLRSVREKIFARLGFVVAVVVEVIVVVLVSRSGLIV
jgi:hypothetical protein